MTYKELDESEMALKDAVTDAYKKLKNESL